MNWIQKHALGILMRSEESTLKQMKPEGVDSNLFSYHIHYLKSNGIIESVTRGRYRLTAKGMQLVGRYSSRGANEAQDVKSVIMLYSRRCNQVLVFEWTRHPYFGYHTLPHDRYNFGISLQDALAEAVADKLHTTVELAQPTYLKSGIVHIWHSDTQISCMSAQIYEVDHTLLPDTLVTRNGILRWKSVDEIAQDMTVMSGLELLIAAISDPSKTLFEVTIRY